MVLPAASLVLGGFNFLQYTNQQQVLDEQQDTIENVENSVSALTSRVAALEAAQRAGII